MRRLLAIVATLGMLAALLFTAGSASAHGTQWTYYYGNVNGTYPVSATISSDRSPSWTVESYTVNDTTGACADAKLTDQGDGNLVLYYRHSDAGGCAGAGPWTVMWASNTAGYYHSTLYIQADGNWVIKSQSGAVVWASGTNRNTSNPLVQYWYAGQVQAKGCLYIDKRPAQGGTWSVLFARPLNLC